MVNTLNEKFLENMKKLIVDPIIYYDDITFNKAYESLKKCVTHYEGNIVPLYEVPTLRKAIDNFLIIRNNKDLTLEEIKIMLELDARLTLGQYSKLMEVWDMEIITYLPKNKNNVRKIYDKR